MGTTINRRTTTGTCFQRGSSIYGAGVGIACAVKQVEKGDFNGASDTLAFSVGLRLRTLEDFLPKKLDTEAEQLRLKVAKAAKTVLSTNIPKAKRVEAVKKLAAPWRSLTAKLERLCDAPVD